MYVVTNGQWVVEPKRGSAKILLEVPGTLAIASPAEEFEIRAPGRFSIDKVILTVKTAPVGAAILCNVQVDGTDLFAAADRPTILAGATSGESITPTGATGLASRVVNQDSVITLDIDQVGAAMTEGADLACNILGHVIG